MAAFTSIATAAALAISAGSSAMSFAQAGKQRKLQREAESAAADAMAEAKKKLEVNFYDQLGIQKEPYELERQALISAGAQAIQAGQEGEARGAGATAGRVQLAQAEGQRQIAGAMGQEMLGLEKLAAAEDARLRDLGVDINLKEATGAQLAARNAQQAAAAATTQGIQGLASTAQQAIKMAPLYGKSEGAKAFADLKSTATGKLGLNDADFQKNIAAIGKLQGVDFSKVAGMDANKFQDFMTTINPSILQTIQQQLPSQLAWSKTPPPTFQVNQFEVNPFNF